jgi:predicted nuclease with TOPRIM domain
MEQGYSNYGSIRKHSHTGSDIPLSVLIDQTSIHENVRDSYNNVGVSNFRLNQPQERTKINEIRYAIQEEIKRNTFLNERFSELENENIFLRAQNKEAMKIKSENEQLKREIKSLSMSDVSRIHTQQILSEITDLKQDGQYLRSETSELCSRVSRY